MRERRSIYVKRDLEKKPRKKIYPPGKRSRKETYLCELLLSLEKARAETYLSEKRPRKETYRPKKRPRKETYSCELLLSLEGKIEDLA